MGIRIICPNGHALKVKSKYEGKMGLCPICNAEVEIPSRDEFLTERAGIHPKESSLSGLSIKVPEQPEEWELPAKRDEMDKICARCHETVPHNASVCPHCHTYIAKLPD